MERFGVNEGGPVGQWEQHHITGVTFHESADSGLTFPHWKVVFPMTGTARSSTSAGRSLIITGSTIWPLPDRCVNVR